MPVKNSGFLKGAAMGIMVTFAILWAVQVYANNSMKHRITTTEQSMEMVREKLNDIDQRLSRIEGALGVEKK